MDNPEYNLKLTCIELIEDLEALGNRCKHQCPDAQIYTMHSVALLKLMEQFLVNEMRKNGS